MSAVTATTPTVMEALSEARREITSASMLLRGAGLAVRGSEYEDDRAAVLKITESAKAAVQRAVTALSDCDYRRKDITHIAFELYRLYSSILVIRCALSQGTVNSEGVDDSPLADALEALADQAGGDSLTGFASLCEKATITRNDCTQRWAI